ncbi:MAG: class I SAM-dependent methyltransferase [Actinobacteria bacterium]|nr:class I SAM-dependent methyltransferase [Actinomycetota bacterium]MBI3687862.1 class I SAM-dependent methyltransferase [Actinomycetota bacterium]
MSIGRPDPPQLPAEARARVESDYYTFMNFDSTANKDGRRHYLPFFDQGPVLELACGRGEFLELLREVGIEARGVDNDRGMVEHGSERGLRIDLGDATVHLQTLGSGSLGGVFCAHFLEHLPAEAVEGVFQQAARVLRPGGTFVAAVPNAASLSVLGYDFWRDPTHVRFYDPMLLAFFAHRAGLEVVESGGNPNNDPGPPPELVPLDMTAGPAVGEAIRLLVRLATSIYPNRRVPLAGRRRAVWLRLGELVSQLDRTVQELQHQVYSLHESQRRLLTQLYPPNEVYLVARAPRRADG